MIIGESHLTLGEQHTRAFNVADLGFFQLNSGTGDETSCWREHPLHAGVGIGRAANHLEDFQAVVDPANLELVGVWVFHRFQHMTDNKGFEALAAVSNFFDLKPDHGQAVE